jgi:hypothetical protein
MHETADVAHALASMDIMHPTRRAVWRIEDTKDTRHARPWNGFVTRSTAAPPRLRTGRTRACDRA